MRFCPDCNSIKVTTHNNMMGVYYICGICNNNWMEEPETVRKPNEMDVALLRALRRRRK